MPGWTVQVLEQMENNILIRPLTLYNGPDARDYVADPGALNNGRRPAGSHYRRRGLEGVRRDFGRY